MPRDFEPRDIFLDRRIAEVHLARDRPVAVAAVRQALESADEYCSVISTFALDGSDARQLTHGPGIEDSPRWSPDGRTIAFLSDRAGGAPQIYLIPVDGGEGHAITTLPCGVEAHVWRPDGRSLLATCAVNVDPDARAEGAQEADPSRAARDSGMPELVWRLPYKIDGLGYTLGQRTHLCLVDADSGKAHAVTRGDFEVTGAAWSPDGERIVYAASRTDPGQAHYRDLWMVDVDAEGRSGTSQRLTHEQASVSAPSWSPDGRWIAFTGALEVGDAQTRLWLCELGSGTVRALGEASLEVAPGELHWAEDSATVAFVQAWRGLQRVARICVPGGELCATSGGDRHVLALAASRQGLAYVAESLDGPLELYTAGWLGGDERRLSQLNDWFRERTQCDARVRTFEVPNGEGGTEKVEGWLLSSADAKRPMPLLVDVHGGPASYVPLDFPKHAYWHLLCSRGWAVLALNAVGSSSYGRAFCERLRERWGELDLPQHLAAVEALQNEGLADRDRVAIAGSSYGGYLSAWAVGTCRSFPAAVVCAPVGNLETHFGTSDSGYYSDPYSLNGKPEGDRELMFRLSPMAHIEQARTPTLFLQGKDDARCPLGQSEEMFVKLRAGGDTPCEMVLYPGGSHHVFGNGKPSHRVDILRRIVDWLTSWAEVPRADGVTASNGSGRRSRVPTVAPGTEDRP